MKQQINLYQARYRPRSQAFPASFMLVVLAVLGVAMLLTYTFASQRIAGVEEQLEVVARQESVAIERLQEIGPLINAVTGETNWAEQLEDSLRMLAERQAMLNLMQGSAFGDTEGFSRHLQALARQDVDGVWLTHISLSALGDKTRLEGRAIRPELIPLYVQDLTAQAAFAAQRFHRFQIESPVDGEEQALHFSMDSSTVLAGSPES